MNLPNDEQTVMDNLASTFGFSLDTEQVDEAINSAHTLGEVVEPHDELVAERLNRESIGTIANDPYGALLDTYDEPRVESEIGPLKDLDFAVKDVIAVSDLQMTCGSDAFSCVPMTDAAVVERLLGAGARLHGKANTDAFAFGPTGEFSRFRKVTNPTAPNRVPGGSSSGSAAAVAAELVDFTLGTDTGGSVRIPSACCGVVGMKPTHKLVPRHGFVDLAPSTDTIGSIARDVKTIGRVLEALAGSDPRDPTSVPVPSTQISTDYDNTTNFRFGVLSGFLETSSETVTSVVQDLLADLRTHPSVDTVEQVEFKLNDIDEAYPLVLAAEFAWTLRQSGIIHGQGTKYSEEWREILSMYRHDLTEHIAMRVLPAAFLDEVTEGGSYVRGREEAIAFGRRLEEQLSRYDALLVPTMRVLPPKPGEVTATEGLSDITGNTAPFSLVGNPVVSVPAGSVDGVPIGIQVVASPFDDQTALSGARLVEQIHE